MLINCCLRFIPFLKGLFYVVLFYVHILCFQTRKSDACYVTFLVQQREKVHFS